MNYPRLAKDPTLVAKAATRMGHPLNVTVRKKLPQVSQLRANLGHPLHQAQGFSAAAFLPQALPLTTQSAVPLPPRRLVPWTPPVTSPAAYSLGMILLCRSIRSEERRVGQ